MSVHNSAVISSLQTWHLVGRCLLGGCVVVLQGVSELSKWAFTLNSWTGVLHSCQ